MDQAGRGPGAERSLNLSEHEDLSGRRPGRTSRCWRKTPIRAGLFQVRPHPPCRKMNRASRNLQSRIPGFVLCGNERQSGRFTSGRIPLPLPTGARAHWAVTPSNAWLAKPTKRDCDEFPWILVDRFCGSCARFRHATGHRRRHETRANESGAACGLRQAKSEHESAGKQELRPCPSLSRWRRRQ